MPGRYPESWLDELRARVDIVQLVSAYVPLKKNGRKYWGLCPFHGEKTASFSVDPAMQMYYCFGCKASGTVFNFLMDMERLEFHEAVEKLAAQVHMPLPELRDDPDYQRRKDQRERLLSANREAAQYFHKTLYQAEGQPSLEYLRRRGLTDSVITRFGLGAAPDSWDALTVFLQEKGYTEEELILCGLSVVREAVPASDDSPAKPRRVFDMFRGRAIFPIIDQYGNVLAFGGRALDGRQPKYLNTSDTPVFNKRKGLYAINLLKKERGLDHVILVEGYMDVVALSQFGVRGAVATLGTALTEEQARLMRRYAPKVYLAYDGDSAGQHAILRGLDILQAQGIPARVLDFPDGLDPDEFIRRDGPEGFERLPALPPEKYRMRRLYEQYDMSSPEGRTEYARECAKLMKNLDPVAVESYLPELSVQTGFPREVLLRQIGQTNPSVLSPAKQVSSPGNYRRQQDEAGMTALRAQEIALSILATGRLNGDIATEDDFDNELYRSIYKSLKQGRTPASIVEEQPTEEDRARVSRVLMPQPSESMDELIRMAEDCLRQLRRQRLLKEQQEISQRINGLSPAEKMQAMARYQEIGRLLRPLG